LLTYILYSPPLAFGIKGNRGPERVIEDGKGCWKEEVMEKEGY